MSSDRPALRTLLLLLGAGNVANGVVMLFAAAPWFARIASDTGPFNGHLVRDVGAAYVAAGVALLFAAVRPAARGPLAAAAAAFLGLHAGTHLVELFSGESRDGLLLEVFGVHLPALIVVILAAASLRRPAEVY
jgi:predicted anti-sigma-YlaC factor YlaD